MGRVKEQLLTREYKAMELDNLKYYCLVDIKSEFIPEANEQDNHYLITYTIMELNSLEQITIKETKKPDEISNKLTNGLEGTLASILLENGVEEYKLDYMSLCKFDSLNHKCDNILDYCISPSHYFFNGIALQDHITKWEHILHIPSSEREQTRLLSAINCNLEWIARNINDKSNAINESLQGINKELDIMNYLAQN